MYKFLMLVVLLFAVTSMTAQTDYSVHKQHREQYGKSLSIEKSALSEDDGSGIIPLKVNETKELSAAVFGYLPFWEYLDNSHQYFRYDLLSHIAAFDFFVSATGSISNPAGWPWTDLINEAHLNGVKVILTAVNFDADDIRTIITNQAVKDVFFANVRSRIETYQLDGVNIDFEGLYHEDKGTVIVSFMEDLTNYIHSEFPGTPTKEVSFAGPAVNWNNHWWLDGLVRSCDYVFIMGYAFAGSWSTSTWANAPLTNGLKNITTTVTVDYHVPIVNNPHKVILGLPYYGHKWVTNSGSAHASVESSVGSTRFRVDEPASQVHGLLWDLTTHTAWYREDIGGGQWRQTWFDNDSSLGLKYDLAMSKNLKGIGMWALGYDGERQELWNLIDRKFGSGEIPAPAKPESFRVVAESQSGLTLKYEVPNYATGFEAYISRDGVNFDLAADDPGNSIDIENLSLDSVYYFKVRAYNESGQSEFTEVLAGIPAMTVQKNLIVNGFDRATADNTFDFITRYGPPMLETGQRFVSTSNEAVFRDLINLTNFDVVIWMLGDESTSDQTFNSFEQEKVQEYLNGGGKLFVTGADIGWDLVEEGGDADRQFYADYLRAEYISDAPNGEQGTYYTTTPLANSVFDGLDDINFDDGTHGAFDVDWPDAIRALTGSDNILIYKDLPQDTLHYAGIAYSGLFPEGQQDGQLIYLSFPFETIYPKQSRVDVIDRVYEYFDLSSPVNDELVTAPENFELFQNYPNPFNPTTKINYNIAAVEMGHAPSLQTKVIVYDVLGREVAILVNEEQSPGSYSVTFDAAGLASGMYIYQLHAKADNGKNYFMRKKMLLLK